VEVRGFEPRTPCMPWALGPFSTVRLSSKCRQFIELSFIWVQLRSTEFIGVAAVVAAVEEHDCSSAKASGSPFLNGKSSHGPVLLPTYEGSKISRPHQFALFLFDTGREMFHHLGKFP
jgi:hypothetical protein